MSEEGATERVANAIGDIERAFDVAVLEIQRGTDLSRAYQGATELVETLRRLFERSADLRAQSAARIFDAERMSLATLADRIGVSKARAAQLIKTAKGTGGRQRGTSAGDAE